MEINLLVITHITVRQTVGKMGPGRTRQWRYSVFSGPSDPAIVAHVDGGVGDEELEAAR